jgi:hypothetical protein
LLVIGQISSSIGTTPASDWKRSSTLRHVKLCHQLCLIIRNTVVCSVFTGDHWKLAGVHPCATAIEPGDQNPHIGKNLSPI